MNKIFIADGAKITGDVSLADGVSVWYNAVLRGDVAKISVGKNTNVQDCCVIHCEQNVPVLIDEGVSVGHGAILHSCTVGKNSLIGMGAIVLNNAKIGQNCIVGAGAVVTQGTIIPDGSMYLGCPAKFVRFLTESEIEANRANALHYLQKIDENNI